jgi:NADH-quinone oxidoreductase subunit G
MSALVKNPFNHDLSAAEIPLVNVQLNGAWIQVPKGTNVVEVARKNEAFLPHYCYHPKLSIPGNCRMCLFEMGTPKLDAERKPVVGADGKPEIAWMPRPQIGCATNVTEGMGIRTDSPLAEECRKGVMEFLLINHPLDCPICDQAGECKLQEFSYDYGQAGSRFTEAKVTKPKRVDIGERIVLDDERCIMCSRCIRFAKEMVHDDVLGFTERGSHTTLAIHPGKRFDSNYSLNTVDICPVGALTSKDFRFKMRVWFLKETKSVCTGCATGCNIVIGSREKTIYRYTPRVNEEVNSHWMCDQGRLGFHYAHDPARLTVPEAKAGGGFFPASWPDALAQIGARLKEFIPSQIALVASARLTNEDLFMLASLRGALGGEGVRSDVVRRVGQADGILRSADLNPNTAGARLMRLGGDGADLSGIAEAIERGLVKALIVTHEDVVAAGIPAAALGKLDLLVYVGLLPNATAERAHFRLPGAAPMEKRGSMINAQGRLQRLNKALAVPGAAREDWEIFRDLKSAVGGGNGIHSIEEVFKAMAAAHPEFSGWSLSKIGDGGVPLLPPAPAPGAPTQGAAPARPAELVPPVNPAKSV